MPHSAKVGLVAGLAVFAFFTVAVARAEPIIVLVSQLNLDSAQSACSVL